MDMNKLKKREQGYLIESEQHWLHGGAPTAGPMNNPSRDFAGLLKEFPGIDYGDKSIQKLLSHLDAQIQSLDVPLTDTRLRKMISGYLRVLESNRKVDCSGFSYVPVGVLPKPNRLVIIGDLHADYCVTLDCLKLGKVIPESVTVKTPLSQVKCIAPKGTVVVQLGDQIDGDGRGVGKWKEPECQSFVKIHKLFDYLNRTGQVQILAVYGNHELMNLEDNFVYRPGRYLSRQEADEIKKEGVKKMKQQIMCTRRPFWIVGDWLLVHGGITDEWFESFDLPMTNSHGGPQFSSEMANRVLQNEHLLPASGGGRGRSKFTETVMSNFKNSHNHGPNPTWNRSYGHTESCTKVPKKLKGIIKNIAVSHTVQEGYEITRSNCGNANVYRLDTGMSRAFGRLGRPQVLIHEKNRPPIVHKREKNGQDTIRKI